MLCVKTRLVLFMTAMGFFRSALTNKATRTTLKVPLNPKLSFFTIQSKLSPRFPYVQHVSLNVRHYFSVITCSTAVRTRILHIFNECIIKRHSMLRTLAYRELEASFLIVEQHSSGWSCPQNNPTHKPYARGKLTFLRVFWRAYFIKVYENIIFISSIQHKYRQESHQGQIKCAKANQGKTSKNADKINELASKLKHHPGDSSCFARRPEPLT